MDMKMLFVVPTEILLPIIALVSVVAGIWAGYILFKIIDKRNTESTKTKAIKILEDAYNDAKVAKKEAILEAKEEIQKIKTDLENDMKYKRSELKQMENRITQKEQYIEKKELILDQKIENIENQKLEINKTKEEINKKLEEQEKIKQNIISELERISHLSTNEAKKLLMDEIRDEARKDAYVAIKEIENELHREANKKAQNILISAIQKCATDVTSESTVSVVSIPSEDMKGRIIGRDGRNIRSIESATGTDLIIDDTPEAITISCFDPVRREIARLSLEKLIMDGRIHPTKIEEIVSKVTKDVEQTIRQVGEETVENVGVYGLHPEIIKLLGKLKYRTSYGQNCLKHSIETSYLAGLIAAEMNVDIKLAKRAGLLHDIGKALDHEVEGTHVNLGVEVARRYKENESVIHCIEAHHFDVDFKSVEAIIVQIADAISSSRPGARRESLENYVKRLEQLEKISNSFKGVEKSYAIQAGREIRIIVKPSEISDESAHFLSLDIAKKIEEEMEYPGQIKVNVIRESRYYATAK